MTKINFFSKKGGQYPNPYNPSTVFRLRPDVARYTNTLAKKGEKSTTQSKVSKRSRKSEEKKEKTAEKDETVKDTAVRYCSKIFLQEKGVYSCPSITFSQ